MHIILFSTIIDDLEDLYIVIDKTTLYLLL